MEQSDHMTPRVFSLMWMVSHPGSLAKAVYTFSSRNLLDDVDGVKILSHQQNSLNTQFQKSSIDADGVPS